eukprot:m.129873 g.129873  ORF g.129873 m.129873 type:complete len:76 (-) comp15710_c0_seq1:2143-2370(-)
MNQPIASPPFIFRVISSSFHSLVSHLHYDLHLVYPCLHFALFFSSLLFYFVLKKIGIYVGSVVAVSFCTLLDRMK